MRIKYESCIFSAVLMMGFATVAYSQSPDVEEGKLASEVTELKTENIALREQLNRVEEQQKMLLEVVNDLKQRLGPPATSTGGNPSTSAQQNFASNGEHATPTSNIPVMIARVEQPETFPFDGAAQPETFPFDP